ncbi:hypothetical protein COLO4_13864 [Corchorus olitorius]|uniref:Uncharacterized protein n=1 Tax=Corchorus olitorius TaxID=93759 RepID=A0A1R3JUE1_9ROSI|nr:hypothetical protein COLO4_13864 [Corchorus olitorius]
MALVGDLLRVAPMKPKNPALKQEVFIVNEDLTR